MFLSHGAARSPGPVRGLPVVAGAGRSVRPVVRPASGQCLLDQLEEFGEQVVLGGVEALACGGGAQSVEGGGDGRELVGRAVPCQFAQEHRDADQNRGLGGAVAQRLCWREIEEICQVRAPQHDPHPVAAVVQYPGVEVAAGQLAQQSGGVGEGMDSGSGVVDPG